MRARTEDAIGASDEDPKPPVRPPLGCFSARVRNRFLGRTNPHPAASMAPSRPLEVDDRSTIGLSRLLPSLLCGEESASIVFDLEGRRADTAGDRTARGALLQIADEESQHERMLAELGARLPIPSDLRSIRGRARRFFVRMSEPGEGVDHFARIAELDACVCAVLEAILRAPIARCHPLAELIARIRRDESRHVVVSRRYIASLGGGRDAVRRAESWVRPELASVLAPVGDAFEALSIDPDALFVRILRGSRS